MGLLQRLKDYIYHLIVKYQLIFHIVPLMNKIVPLIGKKMVKSNHTITDRSGNSIKACMVNGKIFPPFGVDRLETISDICIREDDVILCCFPKTGCHWVHEILHMLVTGKPELTKYGKEIGGMVDFLPNIFLDSLLSPRVLNSHLLFRELPKGIRKHKNKIILTIRNPKDTVVSAYNHAINIPMMDYSGKFEDYFELYQGGHLEYGSYYDFYLSWAELLKNSDTHPVLLVSYEDIKACPIECVKSMANFLNIDITDEFAGHIVEKTSFDVLRKKRAKDIAGPLFRKGEVGDWKNWLSKDQSDRIDLVWKTKMKDFPYQPKYN